MKRIRIYGKRVLMALGLVFLLVVAFVVVKVVTRDQPSTEERIENALEQYYSRPDAWVCRHRATGAYLEQRYATPEPFAVAMCEMRARESLLGSVQIDSVRVKGDRATVIVHFSSGSIEGSSLHVELIHSGGYWRLDDLRGFARFDRTGFRRAYRNSLISEQTSPAGIACSLHAEAKLADPQIEEALQGDPQRVFGPISLRCDRGGIERGLLGAAVSADPELSDAGVSCLEGTLQRGTSDQLERIQASVPAYIALIEHCHPGYLASYARHQLSARDTPDRVINCFVGHLKGIPLSRATIITYDRRRKRDLLAACRKAAQETGEEAQ